MKQKDTKHAFSRSLIHWPQSLQSRWTNFQSGWTGFGRTDLRGKMNTIHSYSCLVTGILKKSLGYNNSYEIIPLSLLKGQLFFIWYVVLILHYFLHIRTWSVKWAVYLPLVPSVFPYIFEQCCNRPSYMYVSVFLPGWSPTSCPLLPPVRFPPLLLLGSHPHPFPPSLSPSTINIISESVFYYWSWVISQ